MDERQRTLFYGAYLFSALYCVMLFASALAWRLPIVRDTALATVALTAISYWVQSQWRVGDEQPWSLRPLIASSHGFAAIGFGLLLVLGS